MKYNVFVIFFLFLIVSCGITKRRYNKGYYLPSRSFVLQKDEIISKKINENKINCKKKIELKVEINSSPLVLNKSVNPSEKKFSDSCFLKNESTKLIFKESEKNKSNSDTLRRTSKHSNKKKKEFTKGEYAKRVADKSFVYGVISLGVLIFPILIFISIPFAVLAMNKANLALNMNVSEDKFIEVKALRAKLMARAAIIISIIFVLFAIGIIMLLFGFI